MTFGEIVKVSNDLTGPTNNLIRIVLANRKRACPCLSEEFFLLVIYISRYSMNELSLPLIAWILSDQTSSRREIEPVDKVYAV